MLTLFKWMQAFETSKIFIPHIATIGDALDTVALHMVPADYIYKYIFIYIYIHVCIYIKIARSLF